MRNQSYLLRNQCHLLRNRSPQNAVGAGEAMRAENLLFDKERMLEVEARSDHIGSRALP